MTYRLCWYRNLIKQNFTESFFIVGNQRCIKYVIAEENLRERYTLINFLIKFDKF